MKGYGSQQLAAIEAARLRARGAAHRDVHELGREARGFLRRHPVTAVAAAVATGALGAASAAAVRFAPGRVRGLLSWLLAPVRIALATRLIDRLTRT